MSSSNKEKMNSTFYFRTSFLSHIDLSPEAGQEEDGDPRGLCRQTGGTLCNVLALFCWGLSIKSAERQMKPVMETEKNTCKVERTHLNRHSR